jgi:nitroreductase
MTFPELVAARCSVRNYRPDAVPEALVRQVLEAAREAPSACNKQPWHFYVVRDAETRRRLFPDARQAWVAQAPVLLLVCSLPGQAWVRHYDGKNFADIDVAIAMEHIQLAATAVGLGACWIGAFDPQVFRDTLNLPAEMEPVAATPLGYANAPGNAHTRRALEEMVSWG